MATTLYRQLGTSLGTYIDSSNWQSWPLAAGTLPEDGDVVFGCGNRVTFGSDYVVM